MISIVTLILLIVAVVLVWMLKISGCFDSALPFHEVGLNLSYSYIAGYIIYVLTVLIPEKQYQRAYRPYIDHMLDEFVDDIVKFFLLLMERDDLSEKELNRFIERHKKLRDIRNEYNRRGGLYRTSSDVTIVEKMDRITDDFLRDISVYERYMKRKQLKIVHEIRKEHIVKDVLNRNLTSATISRDDLENIMEFLDKKVLQL